MEAGEYTSIELTVAHLDRIDRLNGELDGFVEVDREGALEAAAAADARRAAGDHTPVLGLTVGVKDLIDVAGMHTTYGSKAFAANVAEHDATSVARLRAAGAVILGKVNTTEFALFNASTLHGASKNPWDLARTAGGSSNGSATVTSAGLCSFAIGTDTAGSIRTPAAFCGVYGLKPTYGRVPADGIGVLSTFMDTVGPMGRSVDDIATVLQVLAGPAPDDPSSADAAVPRYDDALARGAAGLVVGAPQEWVTDVLDPDVRAAWRAGLDRLTAAGVDVRPVELPDVSDVLSTWRGLTAGDAWRWHRTALAERGHLYSEHSRAMLESCESVTAADVADARHAQWTLRRDMIAAMHGVEALVLPITPVPAPTHEEIATNGITAGGRTVGGEYMPLFAMPFNVTGQPALTVPIAMSSGGLPVAVQIVARPFDEAAVLRAAATLASVMPVDLTPVRYR